MRALGIDWGEKRIGVSLSNSEGTIATPYETVDNNNQTTMRLRELVVETEAEIAVLGLPRSLSGEESNSSVEIAARVDELKAALGIPVELFDERLTTVSAHKQLAEAGLSEKKRRNKVDSMAATIILQAWLDSRTS